MYRLMQQSVIFRCDPSLKQQAERIVAARDDTLSQVLRRALREYVRVNAQLELPRLRKTSARGGLAQGKVR
jgi:predicted transcriptional regulator